MLNELAKRRFSFSESLTSILANEGLAQLSWMSTLFLGSADEGHRRPGGVDQARRHETRTHVDVNGVFSHC